MVRSNICFFRSSFSPLIASSLSQVWSFHKLQCESDDFVFPPLTSQRAEVLRASQGVAIEGSMRWPPEVRRMGIWPPRAWSNEVRI